MVQYHLAMRKETLERVRMNGGLAPLGEGQWGDLISFRQNVGQPFAEPRARQKAVSQVHARWGNNIGTPTTGEKILTALAHVTYCALRAELGLKGNVFQVLLHP